jgi:secondary thiamine-phosphate synthase enzyme
MSAHVRSVLTHSMLSIPVVDGRCALGIWQGVYVWEHRQSPFRRRLTITVLGE